MLYMYVPTINACNTGSNNKSELSPHTIYNTVNPLCEFVEGRVSGVKEQKIKPPCLQLQLLLR